MPAWHRQRNERTQTQPGAPSKTTRELRTAPLNFKKPGGLFHSLQPNQFGLLMPGVGKGQVVAGRTGAGADGAGAAAGLLTAATAGFLAGAAFLAAGFLAGAAFLAAGFLAGAAFLAAGFFAGAAFLAAGFFAGAAFLAAGFLAATFLAAGFLAAGLAFFAATISISFGN